MAESTVCRLSQQLYQPLPPQAGSVHTMFVLLHLHAVVIDELESPQAAHLLVHTQVLPGSQRDQTRVFAKRTFLHFMHKLRQLGVRAAAVVDLQ